MVEKGTSPTQEKLWARAQKVIPGGVHSPVRAFRGVGGTPVFMQSGEGTRLTDVDGKTYVDCCMSWGALILGHQHPTVREEVTRAVARGWTYGTAEPYSLALSEWITRELPFIEKIRFVCSGTEAVLSALRLARGFTGRPKVLKFDGSYHGCVDGLLVQAGSGLAECASPSSLGISPAQAAETIVCNLDDADQFNAAMDRWGSDIAAVIIEPLPANNGLLIQRQEFLELLRQRTRDKGALLIFDEVISGFRVGLGGMVGKTRITPDLVTYGKVIGGGMPIGAYGGRADIMSLVAPLGGVYQAGTLAGNPVACVAGLATLEIVKEQNVFARLEALGSQLESRLKPVLADAQWRMVREGSVFWMTSSSQPVRAISQIPSNAKSSYAPFFHACLDRGLYLAPSAYEVGFLNAAMSEKDTEDMTSMIQGAITQIMTPTS
jgi:glutamate-1-semialdehyde 2,1-aminomutase